MRFPFRVGIVARLSISFAGVAALMVATNIVVQRGILVESTTQVTTVAPSPIATTPIVALAPSAALPQPTSQPIPAPPPRRPAVSSAVLEAALGALAHFEQASQARIGSESSKIDTDYAQSESQLTEALKPMVVRHGSSLPASVSGRIRSELNSYEQSAGTLIHMADARRAAQITRIAVLERLDARVKKSLAGSWTVFGRVVARQYVVQLSAELDTLRQSYDALADAPLQVQSNLATTIDAEQKVRKTMAMNESGLRRSQGNAWYQAMLADMTQLSGLRESSAQLSLQISAGALKFTEQGDLLRHSVFHAASLSSPVRPPRPRKETPAPSPAVNPSLLSYVPAPSPPVAKPTVETRSVRSVAPNPTSRRAIAWGSGAAAVLMLLMCIGIVVSIVAPVRRLLHATSQIAAGDESVHVAGGGITELDTLATAFNKMVAELASAKSASREYQQTLEERIAERTRRLQELSERDPLTGLANRRQLFQLLDAAIAGAVAAGHLLGVLFLDIDNFKYINDGLGHAFGDSVLAAMGMRLENLAGSFGFAARLGGDEFTLVVERATTIDAIRSIGEQVVAAFQQPLTVAGRELVVSVSVGACAYPVHAVQAEALLKAADMALFRAKALGRSQLSMFTSDLLEIASVKFATEQGLRRALERGEFELFFQPELQAETLEVGLVEALIRWRDPQGRLLLPGEFMSVAEESGLAIDIGDWVLSSAIGVASSWHKGAWPQARVAINVSPRQLTDSSFVDRVLDLLREHQLPPRCIELELTESALQTGPSTLAALRRLRAHGVAVALDDFGTGYSSLASLETLPVTRIKLDRALIYGIGTSARSAAIAEAIIGMCQGLGLEITAEGVEDAGQFAHLVRTGSMFIQGYLLAPPVSREELLPLLPIVEERARELLITSNGAPRLSQHPARQAQRADQEPHSPMQQDEATSSIFARGES